MYRLVLLAAHLTYSILFPGPHRERLALVRAQVLRALRPRTGRAEGAVAGVWAASGRRVAAVTRAPLCLPVRGALSHSTARPRTRLPVRDLRGQLREGSSGFEVRNVVP